MYARVYVDLEHVSRYFNKTGSLRISCCVVRPSNTPLLYNVSSPVAMLPGVQYCIRGTLGVISDRSKCYFD
jgi:hypothetical protein